MTEQPHRSRAKHAKVAIAAILLVALCAGLAAVAASTRPTSWTSTAKVVYGSQSSDQLLGRTSVPDDVDRLLATQAQVVVGDTVMSGAAATLGVGETKLRDTTDVENVTASNVLTISVTAGSAAEAARRAQGVAEQYVDMSRGRARKDLSDEATALDQPIADLRAQIASIRKNGPLADALALKTSLNTLVQQKAELVSASTSETGPVRVLADAQAPGSPTSVSVRTAAVIGAGLGLVLVLGIWLVVARPGRDDDPHGPAY